MKKSLLAVLFLLGSLSIPLTSFAEGIRAYVADFAVSPDSADLKTALKRLVVSRISGDGVSTVDSAAEADVVISGSYTALGKMFSLDALAKDAAGRQLAAAFEQGESMDALIPAVGKLSAKLKAEIAKQNLQQPAAMAPPAPAPAYRAPAPEVLRSEPANGWISQRITGAKSGIAAWGGNDYLLADEDGVQLYRQNDKLALLDEMKVHERQKVIGIDVVAPDDAGRVLAFVTILDREAPASVVLEVANGKLKVAAKDLPYMFRAVATYGGAKKLYAQQMGRSEDYYGDVFEASFADGSVKVSNPVKMPRFANIFNFNLLRDESGNTLLTAFNDSGYLLVYSQDGEELWRSSDKFGGSETYFQRRDGENERITGTPFRTRFIDQRITVTEKGEVMVPQNAGFFVLGNQRSYSRYSVVAFAWNGSSLEELWRTKQSQNYLADYSYDPKRKEIVQLEVTQKKGLGGKGGSLIRVTPL